MKVLLSALLSLLPVAGTVSAAYLDKTYTVFFFGSVDNLGTHPPPYNAPPGAKIGDPMRGWVTFRTDTPIENFGTTTVSAAYTMCWSPAQGFYCQTSTGASYEFLEGVFSPRVGIWTCAMATAKSFPLSAEN